MWSSVLAFRWSPSWVVSTNSYLPPNIFLVVPRFYSIIQRPTGLEASVYRDSAKVCTNSFCPELGHFPLIRSHFSAVIWSYRMMVLGSGEINHSGSGENRQFWSNENHQSGVASPQVVLFTRPAAGQPVSQ